MMKRTQFTTFSMMALVVIVILVSFVPTYAVFNAEQGRFLQRDPKGAADVTAIQMRPFPLPPIIGKPCQDCPSEYINGMNVYEGIASNPVTYIDPYGADWLDDEGILTGAQTMGFATTQIAAASGQIYFGANVFTMMAKDFLAFTGGSGRSHLDKLSDCVQKYDPANLAAKGLVAAHMKLPKALFGHSSKILGPKPGFLGKPQGYRLTTLASELGHGVYGSVRQAQLRGNVHGQIARGLRGYGRATSAASVGYGVLLGVAELGCTGSVLLGYDPGR